MGVDESEGGGTRAEAAAAEEGSQSLDRECSEEPGGDLGGSGNWDRPGKRGEEEERRKEEKYTWIDRVGGKETEVNPWRRSDLVRGHCLSPFLVDIHRPTPYSRVERI